MVVTKSWFSLAKDAPGAFEATMRQKEEQPYVFEDESNVVTLPNTLDKLHAMAKRLMNERVSHLADRDRAQRAAEHAEQELRRVQDAIDVRLQDIGMRGITNLGNKDD